MRVGPDHGISAGIRLRQTDHCRRGPDDRTSDERAMLLVGNQGTNFGPASLQWIPM